MPSHQAQAPQGEEMTKEKRIYNLSFKLLPGFKFNFKDGEVEIMDKLYTRGQHNIDIWIRTDDEKIVERLYKEGFTIPICKQSVKK